MSPLKTHAADAQDNFNSALNGITSDVKENGQENIPVPTSVDVSTKPDYIQWQAWSEYPSGGAIKKPFARHNLWLELGFIRGDFDEYTQTYRAEPVITLRDSSDKLTYAYLRSGSSANCIGGSLNIHLEFNKQTVYINDNYTSEQATIKYSDLLAKWASFASGTCADHLGKKYCLISQYLWDGFFWRYGFVATTGTPLYYTTNLPQDFVELYKDKPGNSNYKPVAYSLALRLAFVLSPFSTPTQWEIREMTSVEVAEAMLARSSVRATPSGSFLPTGSLKGN